MDGLKLTYAVHERWPLIKIYLVSGQLKLTDGDSLPQPFLENRSTESNDQRCRT